MTTTNTVRAVHDTRARRPFHPSETDVVEQPRAERADLVRRRTNVRGREAQLDESREVAPQEQQAVRDERNTGDDHHPSADVAGLRSA
jgi:hypothetical protein